MYEFFFHFITNRLKTAEGLNLKKFLFYSEELKKKEKKTQLATKNE